jgi:three-Cys-motif partner protein
MSGKERGKRLKPERLFPYPAPQAAARGKPLALPVWTANKAQLIERYLSLFVRVTRHGTYIDGFAGPQYPEVDEYAAKLVVESTPKRSLRHPLREPPQLRHFYLFEKDEAKCGLLQQLEDAHPDRVKLFPGDFNRRVDTVLCPEWLRPTEATFCLLDQHTFECEWARVRRLADYKRESEYKIELFYFLANWWLDRAVKATTRNEARGHAWWGSDDWRDIVLMPRPQRAETLSRRFRDELGYRYSSYFPIHGSEDGREIKVMYYMIHASDHPEAIRLMRRCFDKLRGRDRFKQLTIPLEDA